LNFFSVFKPVFVDGDANWRLVVFRERADFLARTNVLEDLEYVMGCRGLIVQEVEKIGDQLKVEIIS
jgi:hypothetical protein